MERILITGGAGFLGSHLCDYLLEKNYEVICVDNLCTGDIENIKHLQNNTLFTYIKYDVSDHIDIKGKLDYILHFASPASPIDYLNMPIQTLMVNSKGTYNVLNLAKKKDATFLLASTSEVYGDPLEHPQKESYWGNVNPTGPRGVYDEAKRFAEAITMAYHTVYKLETRIARIFNTYGRRMKPNDGRVIPAFITQALSNEPLTVFGNGFQTRSFCHSSDMVKGIYKLLLSDEYYPVNLGNPHEINILDLAKMIIKLTNSSSTIIHKPLPIDDPRTRQPDITKARKVLHWKPKVALKEGLIDLIAWFKEHS